MLTAIVGKNGTGKSRYLRHLKETSTKDSILFDMYDNSYLSKGYDKAFMCEVEAKIVNGKAIIEGGVISQYSFSFISDFLCREADVYLLDEPNSITAIGDIYDLNELLFERVRDKDVIVVTYDPNVVVRASIRYTINWAGDSPELKEVSYNDVKRLLVSR